MKRVAVLASGRGSNLEALIAAEAHFGSYRVCLVIANIPGAGALKFATDAGREAKCIPSRGVARDHHDALVLDQLLAHGAEILCLAGYMRVLGAGMIERFGNPILNIHPSLLPSFPGLHAQQQAVDAGVRISGATVHLVDAGLDSGPILLQAAVAVEPMDTALTLAGRILAVEHRLYPAALDIVARGAYSLEGRRVTLARSGA